MNESSVAVKIKNTVINRRNLSFYMLIILLISSQIAIPGFLTMDHIGVLLKMAAFTGIAAIGQTMVILSGGIDMSIAGVITLANIVAAQLMNGSNSNILVTILAMIVIGVIVGAANATGVNYLRIPPMIMTLGVGTVLEGIFLLYSKGAPKGNSAPMIRSIVNETSIFKTFAPIVLIWMIISVAAVLFLRYTTFGRKLYAVGSNKVFARFSGINEKKIIYICYMISGIFAAIAGLVLVGYTGTASAESGDPYSMSTIVAVVIGGTAMTGGKGGYIGTVIGAVILAVLDDLLTVINIPASGRIISQGLIILVMVLIYAREKK